MAKRKKDKKWYYKLRSKYRLVIFNDQTFEERISFRLTRLNVFTIFFSLGIIFITITFFLIAYTSFKEYIPGYPDGKEKLELYRLNTMADSLLLDLQQKNTYIQNVKNIIENKNMYVEYAEPAEDTLRYDTITINKSQEDSMLRAEFEQQNMYNLYFNESGQVFESNRASIRNFNFFTPINGIATALFNLQDKHYGIDIAAAHNEPVKSTLDGTVIASNWTLETGYVIMIQHERNLISVYKHNSVLLKKEGDHAKAGEPIAITGQSGELTTGPHLHFELWYNGAAVDPEEYIIFN